MLKNVARPAPAAPMFKPQGRMKMGSRIIFSTQPLMVPMLAWTEAPSLRTIWPWTTFKIAGMAPQVTVQNI